ncbi:hypothetical protein BGP75_09200 [Motiliproteus sp. MSK22-1]|nr:hypothetical protein BGP75_09200 [Motiliproteus sp. MSK22-1]
MKTNFYMVSSLSRNRNKLKILLTIFCFITAFSYISLYLRLMSHEDPYWGPIYEQYQFDIRVLLLLLSTYIPFFVISFVRKTSHKFEQYLSLTILLLLLVVIFIEIPLLFIGLKHDIDESYLYSIFIRLFLGAIGLFWVGTIFIGKWMFRSFYREDIWSKK